MRDFNIVHIVPKGILTSNMQDAIKELARIYKSNFAPLIVFGRIAEYQNVNAVYADNLSTLQPEEGNNIAAAIDLTVTKTASHTLAVVHAQYCTVIDYESIGRALGAAPARIGFVFVVKDSLVAALLRHNGSSHAHVTTYDELMERNMSTLKRAVNRMK
jgi:RecA/RadA recombinase